MVDEEVKKWLEERNKPKFCLNCNSLLKGKQKKYCSKKCEYQTKKEQIKARSKQWKKDNPEKSKLINKEAMKKYIASGKMNKKMMEYYYNDKRKWNLRSWTKNQRKEIMDKFKQQCLLCENKTNLQIHHINYKKRDINKVVVLCKKCHDEIHSLLKSDKTYSL